MLAVPCCIVSGIIGYRAMNDGTDIVEYFVHGAIGGLCMTATGYGSARTCTAIREGLCVDDTVRDDYFEKVTVLLNG